MCAAVNVTSITVTFLLRSLTVIEISASGLSSSGRDIVFFGRICLSVCRITQKLPVGFSPKLLEEFSRAEQIQFGLQIVYEKKKKGIFFSVKYTSDSTWDR